jgi:amino acid transporter
LGYQDHLTYDIPLNSVLASLIISIALLLINIGSSQVLAILLSLFNSALLSSYAITIGCVLLRRLQGRRLPPARYSLGRWGSAINIIALVYIAPIFVFTFFPPVPNPTPDVMNWGCVMVGGVVVLATVYYVIWGRKTYTPPTDTIEDFLERYEETGGSGLVVESVKAEKGEM